MLLVVNVGENGSACIDFCSGVSQGAFLDLTKPFMYHLKLTVVVNVGENGSKFIADGSSVSQGSFLDPQFLFLFLNNFFSVC